MQAIDGLARALSRLTRGRLSQLRDVLERQRHGVDALDDAVVQLTADAVPLINHREALHLLVEAGVVDGDGGMQGEHLDQGLVIGAELGGILLVGQVQPPDDVAADRGGSPQE